MGASRAFTLMRVLAGGLAFAPSARDCASVARHASTPLEDILLERRALRLQQQLDAIDRRDHRLRHGARDATRGGLASALNEIAQASSIGIEIDEVAIPMRAEVKGVCELLGLDPLYLANEGALVLFVPEDQADAALKAMCSTEAGREAAIIGRAAEMRNPRVIMRSRFGGSRIVDMLVGEQLPRIC